MIASIAKISDSGDLNRLVIYWNPPSVMLRSPRDQQLKVLARETHGLIYKDESYAILGACFTVYRDKGCGFLEAIYHDCFEIELEFQRIQFLSKPPQTLQYRGRTLVQTFSRDFICYDKIIVEIKAVSELVDEHRAQFINYLSAAGCKLGLLVNFGHYPRVEHERLLARGQGTVDLQL